MNGDLENESAPTSRRNLKTTCSCAESGCPIIHIYINQNSILAYTAKCHSNTASSRIAQGLRNLIARGETVISGQSASLSRPDTKPGEHNSEEKQEMKIHESTSTKIIRT